MELKDIKFDKHNYRKHSAENQKLIKKSLEETGFGRSVLIDSENCLIAGNGVVSQLPKNTKIKVVETDGTEMVVVKRTDLKTADKKRKELARNDNATANNVEWEQEELKQDFSLDELKAWGIEELPAIETELEEVKEDEVPEQVETKCKRGDIWQLGEHRLMCGDSTVITDVEKLMNGEKADMVFTDPPYGMGLNTDWSGAKSNLKFYKEKGCQETGNKYEQGLVDEFTPEIISNLFACFNYVKEIFLFGADYFAELLPNKNNGSWIVWDKRSNDGTNEEYINQSDKMFGSCFELCWSKNKHRREIARVKWAGIFGTEKEFDKKRCHPTQKPSALVKWFLDRYSKDNELIVDLFGGSGSTLIACEQLHRKCRMMELDEHYCDIIIQRWENLTGKQAKLCK
jgi:DNA modification methylase